MSDPSASTLLSAFQPSSKQIDQLRMSVMIRKARDKTEILIADADPRSKKLLHDMLKSDIFKNACKIYQAATAKEAWSTYLSYAPDIAFLGMDLPDMDGQRLAKIVRLIDAGAFLVMHTGTAGTDGAAIIKEGLAKGFIEKPYDNKKVLEMIQKYQAEKKAKK